MAMIVAVFIFIMLQPIVKYVMLQLYDVDISETPLVNGEYNE